MATDEILRRRRGARGAWIAVAVGVGVVVLSATMVPGFTRQSAHNEEMQNAVIQRIQQLRAFETKAVFVSWGGALQFSHVHPLSHATADLRELEWVGLGWRLHSPDFFRHVASLGLSDLYMDIARRDDVYLGARPNHIDLFEEYLREHYGLQGHMDPVEELVGVNTIIYGMLQIE